MVLPAELALLLALLLICSFFPGFFVLRRLSWTPLEKLCGAAGLSLTLLYLGAWSVYCFGPRNQRPAYWAMAGVIALTAAVSWADARRLFGTFRIRQAGLALGFLVAFTAAALCIIRVYSGAGWTGDWYEHFQRSLFFLDRLPPATKIIQLYEVPARPPMQNVLAGFFLGLTSERFELFQAIFAFLGILLFLPCALLLPALGFGRRRRLLPLVALFAASPVVMQNVTYTWTKALAAFYVILAICLYLAGWRKDDRTRTTAAFVALAAGMVVHYSAGPYLVFIGLHYLVRTARARRWRDLALPAALSTLILATWFGWSLKVYGTRMTVASNTSVTSSAPGAIANARKVVANISDTIVPVWMRGESPAWDQPSDPGRLRDETFVFYQLNLIFAMGAIGGPAILLLAGTLLMRRGRGREQLFWRILIPFCIVVGIAVVGERDVLGVPHLTLLALEAAGLTLLAAAFPTMDRAIRVLVVVGCCIDFSLGVFLHARVQSLENTPQHTPFAVLTYSGAGQFKLTDATAGSLSKVAYGNWMFKHRGELLETWLRELPRGHESDAQFAAAWPALREELATELQDDAKNWGGWGARNGGVTRHLGDWVAGATGRGTDVASGVFVFLFAGCMWLTMREALKAPVRLMRVQKRARVRRAHR